MSSLGDDDDPLKQTPRGSSVGMRADELIIRSIQVEQLTVGSINGQPVSGDIVMTTGAQTLQDKSLIDTTTRVVDETDPTIAVGFDAAGSANTTMIVRAEQLADRTHVLPDGGGDDVIVLADAAQTLGMKSLVDTTTRIIDAADSTRAIAFNAAGSTSTTATITSSQVANRTYTIPDSGANASFVMTEGTQTINGTKTFSGGITASTISATGGTFTLASTRWYANGTAQTVGAVNATLYTFPTNPGTVMYYTARICASTAAGVASGVFKRSLRASNIGGVVTVGPYFDSYDQIDATISAAGVSLVQSGNAVGVVVTGVAGETIKWSGLVEVVTHTV